MNDGRARTSLGAARQCYANKCALRRTFPARYPGSIIVTIKKISACLLIVSVVSGCSESVEQVAQKNGCPELEHRIEKLFVSAGIYSEARRDEEASPSNNLQRAANLRNGVTGGYSQTSYEIAEYFFVNARVASPFLPQRDDYGSLLVEGIEANDEAENYDIHFRFFRECETYVNQQMSDESFVTAMQHLFASPHTWQQ